MDKKRLACLIIAVVALMSSVGLIGSASAQNKNSLYKRLGGYDAIAAVTDDFIGRLAADKQLGRYFVGHSTNSLQHIRQLVVDQICAATGGPCVYIGRDMKSAHQGMGITEEQFNIAAGHLSETLDKFKVPAKEKNELLGAVASFKNDIVEQKSMMK